MLPTSEIFKVFNTVGTQKLHCLTLLQSQDVLRFQHHEIRKKTLNQNVMQCDNTNDNIHSF